MNEVLTTEEMAEADRRAVALGVPSLTLMENAGRAVADEAAKMVSAGSRIAVLCGPGNNGGDGFVAARHLKERGFEVRVACLFSVDQLKGDAAEMAKRWNGSAEAFGPKALSGAALAIDAIFGAGLSRAVPPEVGNVIAALRRAEVPVLAVDVPSGVDGNTGSVLSAAVLATRTITFERRKFGHVLYPGRDLCGDVVVAGIGFPPDLIGSMQIKARMNTAPRWSPPMPDTHKYRRGHALVVSGPPHQTGAARLAARAALRAGAGAVSLATPHDALAINAAHLTAVMLAPFADEAAFHALLAADEHQSVLIGPGAPPDAVTRARVRSVLETGCERYCVLDAGALTAFENEPETLFAMTRRNGYVVMTPHEGEFRRLFGEIPGSKVARAKIAAERAGVTLVLKGADTVIADRSGDVTINTNAPSTLATAGSGDVLAGFIAGCMSQGLWTYPAACASVWLHGECANEFGPGLIAEDLPDVLPRVLSGLAAKPSEHQV